MENFPQEINTLKSAFKSNGYPNNFINLFIKNKVSSTGRKLQLVSVLLHTGKSSLNLRARLRRSIEKQYIIF